MVRREWAGFRVGQQRERWSRDGVAPGSAGLRLSSSGEAEDRCEAQRRRMDANKVILKDRFTSLAKEQANSQFSCIVCLVNIKTAQMFAVNQLSPHALKFLSVSSSNEN